MADNMTKTEWAAAGTIRTKDRSGVETTIVALDLNPSGSETLMTGTMPVSGTVAVTGVATDANIDTKVGALTETAPGTDTASSGLNGRLQRIAQRLTSLIALLPSALGGNGGLTIEGIVGGTAVPVSGTFTAAGDVAHDAADSGNPVKVGHKAIAVGSSPTAVAAGDRTDSYATLHGIPFVQPGHPNVVTLRATYSSAQTDTAIISVGAGNKIVVTRVRAALANDATGSPAILIGFHATTTPTTTGVVYAHPGLPPGLPDNCGDGSGILGIGGDGEDLRITCDAPDTASPPAESLDIIVSYYLLPA